MTGRLVRRGVRGYRVRYLTADAAAKGCTAIEWRAPLGVDPTGRWFRDPPAGWR